MSYDLKRLSNVFDIKTPLIPPLGKAKNWFWSLGYVCIGLCGCQGNAPVLVPSLADVTPSSSVETLHARSLDPPFTLAILPLENLSPNPRLHWLGRSLSEMLTNDLAKSPSLSVVDREALGSVLREQWLQQRGFSSSISSLNLGKIQGVRYLVRGGFHQYGDNLTIDLQIIDVETGLVVSSLSAQGLEEEIPRLEHNLVVQMLNLFEPSIDSTASEHSNQFEEEIPKLSLPARTEDREGLQMMSSGSFGLHSVHQVDIRLSLERITQHRIQAYQAAKKLWQEGWSTEMGQPLYRVWQSPEESDEPIPLLSIPFSLFMQQNRIAEVLKQAGGEGLPSFVNLDAEGITREQDDGAGASQLFFEHVRQPQRLFIRALNEDGELMAVFSDWSWQTEAILDNSNSDRIFLPMWPQSFISGFAEFPVAWVERGGQHATFDAMMMPIPAEYRDIVLEPIVLSDQEEKEGHDAISKDADLLLPLKNWIQLKWNPPIAEALPVDKYLPANKQTVRALLHLQAGKIEKVQFFNVPHDALFSRSLEELQANLLGYCVICQKVETSSSGRVIQTIRLQLTLEKDLHALRFGSLPQ